MADNNTLSTPSQVAGFVTKPTDNSPYMKAVKKLAQDVNYWAKTMHMDFEHVLNDMKTFITPTTGNYQGTPYAAPEVLDPQPATPAPSATATQGTYENPLPNSIKAQAEAQVGQWILSNSPRAQNGKYQLTQNDINWAKQRIAPQATAPRKTIAKDTQVPLTKADYKSNSNPNGAANRPR